MESDPAIGRQQPMRKNEHEIGDQHSCHQPVEMTHGEERAAADMPPLSVDVIDGSAAS